MNPLTELIDRYIAIWNETDATRRTALIAESWHEAATYIDPLMRGEGHEQINALVEAVHARFSWGLGPTGGEHLIKGTDFAVLEGGRLKSVHGFIDQLPEAA